MILTGISMTFTESTIEETTLEWLKNLGYTIVFGSDIAPKYAPASLRDGLSMRKAELRMIPTAGRRKWAIRAIFWICC